MASPERPGKLAGLAAQIKAARAPEPTVERTPPIAPPSREDAPASHIARSDREVPVRRGRGANRKEAAGEGERPPKSSDPEFVQVTMFVRRVNYAEAQNRLRTARTVNREKRDFSDVADALVAGWLDGRFVV